MLTAYTNKLLCLSPNDSPSVCLFCREPGRLEVVRVHGKATQRVVGCRCDRRDRR